METRINKYLADRGICSRRAADHWIETSRVYINGIKATLGSKVTEADTVTVDGIDLVNEKPRPVVIAFHKPIGLITSMDPMARDNVVDFIKYPLRIFPIGRLDVASSGLLLLTNDGALAEKITHPRFAHEKEYVVTVDKEIAENDLQKMRDGIVILGRITKKAKVTREAKCVFRITLTEGRNRQIRRMCEELGYNVRTLHRVRIMNIKLDTLPKGHWRNIIGEELDRLKHSIGMEY